MRRVRMILLSIPVWSVSILIMMLYLKQYSGQTYYQALTGIELSGVRGSVDYASVSRWLCITLPVYGSVGFWLYQQNECRLYLIYRCQGYNRWWQNIVIDVTLQGTVYFFLWGTLLILNGKENKSDLFLCMMVLTIHTVIEGILIAVIWENTLFTGSVLVMIAAEFAVIAAGYYLPEALQNKIMQYFGMYRYIDIHHNYRIIIEELLFIGVCTWLPSKFYTRHYAAR